MKSQFSYAAVLLMLGLAAAVQARTPIKVIYSEGPREALILDVLKLVISKSDRADKYTYESLAEVVTEKRGINMIKSGRLDVTWVGVQEQYANAMLPIRIPVLKGLLGHRIFIIREGDQAKFDKVKTLEDLRRIPLGQALFWGDTAILKANKMNVVAPVRYASLMPMLARGRFDFFPRALHEPFSEVKREKDLHLAVEDSVLIIYPFAMYFYVHLDNKRLAMDIEQGFRRAIADGSYDALFFNHPLIKEAFSQTDLKNRKVFHLQNPYLPSSVPVDDKSLWLDIESLK